MYNQLGLRLPSIVFSICFLLLLTSCVKPPVAEPETPTVQPGKDAGAFIIQEGNFQWGNASLGYINLKSGVVEKDIFKKINDRPIGDVLQSGSIIQDKLWLAVNNSSKIEIIDPQTGSSEYQITGLRSPRYILPVNQFTVYVSDLYANCIWIIDILTRSVKGNIPLAGWTEKMIQYNDKVWVCNKTSKYTYIIDSKQDKLIDSIETGIGNNSLVIDKNNRIWVLSSGSSVTSEKGKLTCISPDDMRIIKQLEVPGMSASSLCISPNLEIMYYLQGGVNRMHIQDTIIPASAWLSELGNYYGLSVHPISGHVFICDAKDYVSEGRLLEYTPLGEQVRATQVGIIPSALIFYPQ